MRNVWSRSDALALGGLSLTVLGITIGLTTPELRCWLGLDGPEKCAQSRAVPLSDRPQNSVPPPVFTPKSTTGPRTPKPEGSLRLTDVLFRVDSEMLGGRLEIDRGALPEVELGSVNVRLKLTAGTHRIKLIGNDQTCERTIEIVDPTAVVPLSCR